VTPPRTPPGPVPRRRNRRGVAATEFALIAAALFVIVQGIVDIGGVIQQSMMLQKALRAGGQFAFLSPTNLTGINEAVTGALPASYAASNVCVCVGVSRVCGGGGSEPACPGSGTYTVIYLCRPARTILFQALGTCQDTTGTDVTGISATYVIRLQ
jgi:Flp pilus assembly protein TadG